MSALKYDSEKPDLSHISLELVEAVAKVRMYGQEKYTIYGDCTCAVSVTKNQSTPGVYADAATINTSNSKTQSTETRSLKTLDSGNKKILENTSAPYTTRGVEETKLLSGTGSRGKKWSLYWTPDAAYAARQSDSSLTTITSVARSEQPYAQPATSASAGLKNPNGLSAHSPTCDALKVKSTGRSNWKKGFKVTRSCAAALRHIFQFLSGETNDSESGLSHLGHAVCCLEHALYDMKHHPANDDRDSKKKESI